MQAGVFMEMTTNAELSDLMEKVHQEVFGKSIKERQEESHSRKDEVLDYSQYDQPTYERKR